MKKTIIVFVLVLMVLALTALWFFSSTSKISPADYLGLGVLVLVVVFAIFIGYKRMVSAKRGEPADDEMSKKVMQKTASFSYYISLYLWLCLMYFSEKLRYETHTVIGMGIMGMAVVFAGCWLFFKFRGVRNE